MTRASAVRIGVERHADAYEALRYTGMHFDRWWVRLLGQPGLWLQRLTTGEPTDDMLEVAIASLSHTFGAAPTVDEGIAGDLTT